MTSRLSSLHIGSQPLRSQERQKEVVCARAGMAGGWQSHCTVEHRILASGTEKLPLTSAADEGSGFCILRAYFLLAL